MQKQIERGQSPKSATRAEVGKVAGEQDQCSFRRQERTQRRWHLETRWAAAYQRRIKLAPQQRMERAEVNKPNRGASDVGEDWMRRAIASRSDLRFDDLHIDLVDRALSAQENWIPGSLESFRIAARARDRHAWPFLVGVGFSLKGSSSRRGLTFQTFDEIQHELGESPPSLYLFPQTGAAIPEDKDAREVTAFVRPDVPIPVRTFLRESLDENDGTFQRAFWVIG